MATTTDIYHRHDRPIDVKAQEYPGGGDACYLSLRAGDSVVLIQMLDPAALIDLGHSILLEARILLARRSERPPVAEAAHDTDSNGDQP